MADVETKIKEVTTTVEAKPPNQWKVLFLNDDYTPMEFVVALLVTIFRHSEESAEQITMEIHNTGSAVVGMYTHEIAEQKSIDAISVCRQHGHPLQITIEEDK